MIINEKFLVLHERNAVAPELDIYAVIRPGLGITGLSFHIDSEHADSQSALDRADILNGIKPLNTPSEEEQGSEPAGGNAVKDETAPPEVPTPISQQMRD